MQVMIEISEKEYNRIQNMDWKNGDRIYDEAERAIHYGKPLPEIPTNGDMAQAIFDGRGYKAIKERMEHTMWWNAPYKAESEDKNDKNNM